MLRGASQPFPKHSCCLGNDRQGQLRLFSLANSSCCTKRLLGLDGTFRLPLKERPKNLALAWLHLNHRAAH